MKAQTKTSWLTDWGHIGILSLKTVTCILCTPIRPNSQQLLHDPYRLMTVSPKYLYTLIQITLAPPGHNYCDTYVASKGEKA